jgi:hypothetical protein
MSGYADKWKGARMGDEKSGFAGEAAKAWIDGWLSENLKAV